MVEAIPWNWLFDPKIYTTLLESEQKWFFSNLVQILSTWTVMEICSTIMGFYENSLDAVINIPFKSSIANMFTGRWLEIILFFCGASTKRSHYICRLNRSLLFDKKQINNEFFFFFLTCKNSSLHWKNVNWKLLYKSAQKCQTLDSFLTSFLF